MGSNFKFTKLLKYLWNSIIWRSMESWRNRFCSHLSGCSLCLPVHFSLNFSFLDCTYYSFLIDWIPHFFFFPPETQLLIAFPPKKEKSVRSTHFGSTLVFRGLTSTLPCDGYLSICFSIWDENNSSSWLWKYHSNASLFSFHL